MDELRIFQYINCWQHVPLPVTKTGGAAAGPDVGGPHAPYRQSERTEIYNKLVDELVQKDLAFPCFCTDEEIDESRKEAERDGHPPIYSGRWATATPEVRSWHIPHTRVLFLRKTEGSG